MISELAILLQQIEKWGWSVTALEQGWLLERPPLPMKVHLSITQTWACFLVPLDKKENASPTERVALYRHLLLRTERMFMAKYALDEDGALFMLLEMPVAILNQVLFDRVLAALTRYIEQYQEPIPVLPMLDDDVAEESDIVPGLPDATVFAYMQSLDALGWHITDLLSTMPWHIVYKKQRTFRGHLTVGSRWTYMQIPLLEPQKDRGGPSIPVLTGSDPLAQALFVEYLLRLNSILFMAKIGLSSTNEILLMVEVPTEILDFALLRLMARTSGTYLDRYALDVQIMASLPSDQNLSELLLTSLH